MFIASLRFALLGGEEEASGLFYRLGRDQYLLEVGIATRPRQPYVAGPKDIADMEQHRDLPQPVVPGGLGAKMAMPFRVRAQEVDWRRDFDPALQDCDCR